MLIPFKKHSLSTISRVHVYLSLRVKYTIQLVTGDEPNAFITKIIDARTRAELSLQLPRYWYLSLSHFQIERKVQSFDRSFSGQLPLVKGVFFIPELSS